MSPRAPVLACVLALAAAPAALAQPAPDATAELRDARGRNVGTATFTESARGVLIRIEGRDMPPGWHGLHLHMVARCDGPRFDSAGGHTHTGSASIHGLLNRRATDTGDLPNVNAGPGGRVDAEVFSTFVTLRTAPGRERLLDRNGSALLIHAQADDHQTQPIGGSGDRIACGVIRAR